MYVHVCQSICHTYDCAKLELFAIFLCRSHDWSHDYSIKTRFPSRTLSDDQTLLE